MSHALFIVFPLLEENGIHKAVEGEGVGRCFLLFSCLFPMRGGIMKVSHFHLGHEELIF